MTPEKNPDGVRTLFPRQTSRDPEENFEKTPAENPKKATKIHNRNPTRPIGGSDADDSPGDRDAGDGFSALGKAPESPRKTALPRPAFYPLRSSVDFFQSAPENLI
jgi:hypothetical protein